MVDGRFFPDMAETEDAFGNLVQQIGTRDICFAAAYEQGPAAFEDAGATAHFGAMLDQKTPIAWSQNWTRLDAGLFAIFPHYGPLTALHLTWHRAARVGLSRLNLKLRSTWMYEVYLTSQLNASRHQLTALVHLPVEKSTIG